MHVQDELDQYRNPTRFTYEAVVKYVLRCIRKEGVDLDTEVSL
jgi:hypothetical protein